MYDYIIATDESGAKEEEHESDDEAEAEEGERAEEMQEECKCFVAP